METGRNFFFRSQGRQQGYHKPMGKLVAWLRCECQELCAWRALWLGTQASQLSHHCLWLVVLRQPAHEAEKNDWKETYSSLSVIIMPYVHNKKILNVYIFYTLLQNIAFWFTKHCSDFILISHWTVLEEVEHCKIHQFNTCNSHPFSACRRELDMMEWWNETILAGQIQWRFQE